MGGKDTKTHMSSLFDMRQNKAFCPILSLLFIIREVSHARTMTHKLELDPFWTSKLLLSIFFNFYFLLINREKKGPRVQDPDFSLELQRFRGNDPKGPKRVQKGPFFEFVGHSPLFARTVPHKKCVLDPFWTPSAPFFWSKNLGLKSYKSALVEHLLTRNCVLNRPIDRRIRDQSVVKQLRIRRVETIDPPLGLFYDSVRIVQ